MDNVNHQHLYYFWVVAKEGSVAAACRRLHLAQPTISGQVIQLEKEFGKKLFERHRKRLILTEEGRLVLAHSEKIFNQTREMLEALKGTTEQKTILRIGVDEDVSKQATLQLLHFLQHSYSKLQVQMFDGPFHNLVKNLERFNLDLVLSGQGQQVGEAATFVRTEVARMEVYFTAAPLLARKIQSFPKDLSKVPLILPSEDSSLWSGIQHFLIRHKIDSTMIIEAEDAGLMRQAALSGLGAAPLTSIAAEESVRNGTLVQLGKALPGISKTLWLTARRDYKPDSAVGRTMRSFQINSI